MDTPRKLYRASLRSEEAVVSESLWGNAVSHVGFALPLEERPRCVVYAALQGRCDARTCESEVVGSENRDWPLAGSKPIRAALGGFVMLSSMMSDAASA